MFTLNNTRLTSLNDKEILQSSPYTLFNHLDKYFSSDGTEDWLSWDPDALIMYIQKNKGSTITDGRAIDKIMAVQSFAYRRDIATENADAFEKLVHAFNNNPVIIDVQQQPEIEEVFYAVKEMQKISEHIDKKMLVFTGEIPGYVAACAFMDRLPVLPRGLLFAQDSLDFLNGNKYKDVQSGGLIKLLKQFVNAMDDIPDLHPEDIEEFLGTLEKSSGTLFTTIAKKIIGIYLYTPEIIE